MRVVSDATLVTGSPAGPVSFPPGAPVGLPADDAKDLIARGLARAYSDQHPEQGDTLDTRVNLNTATAAELAKAITGVGLKSARDIVAHRKKLPFASLADCAERVGGVSVDQLESAGVIV